MQLTVPVYVERIASEKPARFWAAALFIDHFERTHAREDRALAQLESDIRREVNRVAAGMRHDDIAYWAYCPAITTHKIRLHIALRRHAATCEFFFAAWEALGRRLVISPRLPNLCFEWPDGVPLQVRATEVLNEYFRTRERDNEELERPERPEDFAAGPGARLTYLRISAHGTQRFREDREREFAHLGAEEKMSGAEELDKVGRCLNRQFPNELQRALLRDDETTELLALFDDLRTPPAPIVLVGPSQVGKTAIIHEFLHHRLSQNGSGGRPVPELWLLSPQRIISGMSFVGQWEERFLAILRFATERRHILYVDDLLGLFQAGRSRDSDLSIGHLLKVHLEENQLPLVAETSPEAWGRLREIDRGFSDLFHVLPIREPSEPDTLRILVRYLQDVEARHRCRFAPDTLPLVVALQRRFVRSRAFPGKAAEMLRHLAASRPGETVRQEDVYAHFASRTGINPLFLDNTQALDPAAVRRFFTDRIMGQSEALEAMTAAVLMTKSRLNDTNRPVASMLFLGPTGVGKTECAKALAEFFFGSVDRMVRFDMNEFGGPDATLRLIGSFGRPGGQLTGAVRRNPYTVLLLDEIEKANPDVFDLLLQVLGDGRLTDANGITTDFCNTIIILTSNLGTTHTRQRIGFTESENDPDGTFYRQAAEEFFRPELFNRIDRVIAFHELDRAQVAALARRMVARMTERFGLRQRHQVLHIHPEVFGFLTEAGFAPEFGARALRRTIEDHLITPLAVALNDPANAATSVLDVSLAAEGRSIAVRATDFPQARRRVPPEADPDPDEALALCESVSRLLDELDSQWEEWTFDDESDPARPYYFHLRELARGIRLHERRLRRLAESEARRGAGSRSRRPAPPSRGRRPAPAYRLTDAALDGLLPRLRGDASPDRILAALAENAGPIPELARECHGLRTAANRLAFIAARDCAAADSLTLAFEGTGPPPPPFLRAYCRFATIHSFGSASWQEEGRRTRVFDPEDEMPAIPSDAVLALEGHALRRSLDLLEGAHAHLPKSGPVGYFAPAWSGRPAPPAPPAVAHLLTDAGWLVDFETGVLLRPERLSLASILGPLYPDAVAAPATTAPPATP